VIIISKRIEKLIKIETKIKVKIILTIYINIKYEKLK
jgi:hypothetical protein